MTPRLGTFGVDLGARNIDIRPQDDFFRHANGKWLDEFEVPPDLSVYGSFTKLGLEAEEQVRALIEAAVAAEPRPGSEAQKIADLYRDYMDTEVIERKGLMPLERDIADIRAAGSHEEIATLLARLARIGVSTPFPYHVTQDAMAPDRYIATFVQGGLGLPNRDYYLDSERPRFAGARDARRVFATTILEAAGHDEPEAAAGHVLELETALAGAHWPVAETRDVDRTYNKLTPAELRVLVPDFPWDGYLAGLGLEGEEHIVLAAPSAYQKMGRIFAATPVARWQAYLVLELVSAHAALLPASIDAAHFRFRSIAVTGTAVQRERTKRAIAFVNGAAGEAVGKLYVSRHFSEDAKLAVEGLVLNIVEAMGRRIDGLDWMSGQTKRRAREKLEKINTKIGYPETWRDYSSLEILPGDLVGNARRARLFSYERNRKKLGSPVDRSEWHMTPQTVNAYYNPRMNEIVFPAAILQPPFFDPEADPAVNYGAIGAVIGHEIGHGFDDQGRKFDGDGRKLDWWSAEDAERFSARAGVLVEQYDAYSVLDDMRVNGRLTLGENIGDLGGVELAYYAYRLSLDVEEQREGARGDGGNDAAGGITCDQRFFLAYAQIWRGKMRDERLAMILSSDPHSPMEFRVNGAVRNVDAWYRAFGVREGDALYLPPDARVRIW